MNLNRSFFVVIGSVFLIFNLFLWGEEEVITGIQPPRIGNFALPNSQQPTPLISFGELILDQGQFQFYSFADYVQGTKSYYTDILPGLLYGIRSDLSVYVSVPTSAGNKYGNDHSAGLEDASIQFEYAYFNSATTSYENQGTIVANVTFPTGSATKNPATGSGSTSFFVGTTFDHMRIYWNYFTSFGALIHTSKNGTRFGDQILYEGGFGRFIASPPGWLYTWMVEFNGIYTMRSTVDGKTDNNTGGNIIFVTPSIWISSQTLIFQFGPGFPVIQHLNGHQYKRHVALNFAFGYTF